MHITWHGQYTVKMQTSTTTVVLDPHSPVVGLGGWRGKTDILALSNPSDETMSHTDGVQGKPLIINSPGEYSVDHVTLHARGWLDEQGREHSLMRWNIDEMVLLYMGALNRELNDEELAHLEQTTIDVLFVPVGGGDSLNTSQAVKLTTTIEPRVVIPIHFALPKLKQKLDEVNKFAEELGADPKKREPKLNLKASELPAEGLEVVILEP